MTVDLPSSPLVDRPGFSALFVPKLVSVLREGYGLAAFRADAMAGLTVAIVALPLSMAIAIASRLIIRIAHPWRNVKPIQRDWLGAVDVQVCLLQDGMTTQRPDHVSPKAILMG